MPNFVITHLDGSEETIKATKPSDLFNKLQKQYSLKIKSEDGTTIEQSIRVEIPRSTKQVLKTKLDFKIPFSIKPYSKDLDILCNYINPVVENHLTISDKVARAIKLGYLTESTKPVTYTGRRSKGNYKYFELSVQGREVLENAVNNLEAKHVSINSLCNIIYPFVYGGKWGLDKAFFYNLVDQEQMKITPKLLGFFKTKVLDLIPALLNYYYGPNSRFRNPDEKKLQTIFKLLLTGLPVKDYAIILSNKYADKISNLLPAVDKLQ